MLLDSRLIFFVVAETVLIIRALVFRGNLDILV